MRIISFTLLVSALVMNTANANENVDQTKMRAGLWEISTSSDLLLLAPHVPKDQMQQLKDLAKEYGLEVPNIKNGAAISKVCITQAMANQKKMPNFYQEELGCTSTNVVRTGNRYKSEFTCSSKELKGTGNASGLLTSPETFTGESNFQGFVQGSPINESADIEGRWLNRSCGDVKSIE